MKIFFKLFFFFFFLIIFLFAKKDSIQISFTPSSFDSGSYALLTNAVSKAINSIYGAIHEFDLVELSKIMATKSSNIYIELLLESRWLKEIENKAAWMNLTNSNIKIILDKRKSGLMHNKYLIIDDQFVWTGSANFTYNGFFKNYNDGILIKNKEIVRQYKLDYFRLQQSKKRFFNKEKIFFETKKHGKVSMTAIFSRTKNIDSKKEFINPIFESKQKINFLSFVFSSYDISFAIEKKLEEGIVVKGIFDDSFESDNVTKNWKIVPFQRLWQKGADVKYDDGKAKMHHKALMIDDNVVMTGSFNFSKNAVKNNNENFLIIENKKINQIYQRRFNDLWRKFPQKTLYERYIVAKRKNKSIKNFNQFIQKNKSKERLVRERIISKFNKKFRGKIVLFNHEGKVGFLVENQFFLYPLYGIHLPIKGNQYYNQEPQHTIIRQKISAIILHKSFLMKIVDGEVIIFEDKKIINEEVLRKGLAYLSKKNLGYKTSSVSFQYLKSLKNAFQQAQTLKKGIFSKQLKLELSPFDAIKKIEEIKINFYTKENKYSEVNYKKGFLIGNRKTKKYYYPNDRQYKNYTKNLKDSKLIFFKNKFNAEKSGYFYR